MPSPDQKYDLMALIPPGYNYQPFILDALYAAWAANNFNPLTLAAALAAVEAVAGPEPAPVTSLKQWPALDIEAPRFMNDWPAGLTIGPPVPVATSPGFIIGTSMIGDPV